MKPTRGKAVRPKEEKMATFFKTIDSVEYSFTMEFFRSEYDNTYYIRIPKTVAAKLLLFEEIVGETYADPDRYGYRQYLSMSPERKYCILGVHYDKYDGIQVWNSSYRGEKRVLYNTFMAAEDGRLKEVIDEIFDAMDYFYGIEDARILGRFAPEYVMSFIQTGCWYTPYKTRDIFELTPRELLKSGLVRPGYHPNADDDN